MLAKTLLEHLQDQFGVSLREEEDPEVASVGTTSVRLLRGDAQRFAFTVVNLSANVVYIRPGRASSSSTGIRLDANGGAVSVNPNDDFTLPMKEWWIIADGAASAIYTLTLLSTP